MRPPNSTAGQSPSPPRTKRAVSAKSAASLAHIVASEIDALDPSHTFVAVDLDKQTVKYSSEFTLHEAISGFHGEEITRAFIVVWLCTLGGYLPANMELEKRYSIGRPKEGAELDILLKLPTGVVPFRNRKFLGDLRQPPLKCFVQVVTDGIIGTVLLPLLIALGVSLALAAWSFIRSARMASRQRISPATYNLVNSIEEHMAALRNELLQIEMLLRESSALNPLETSFLTSRHAALQSALQHYESAVAIETERSSRAA